MSALFPTDQNGCMSVRNSFLTDTSSSAHFFIVHFLRNVTLPISGAVGNIAALCFHYMPVCIPSSERTDVGCAQNLECVATEQEVKSTDLLKLTCVLARTVSGKEG